MWNASKQIGTLHEVTGVMAEKAVGMATDAQSSDNLSVIVIGLRGLKGKIEERKQTKEMSGKTNKTGLQLNRQFFTKAFEDLNIGNKKTNKGKFVPHN